MIRLAPDPGELLEDVEALVRRYVVVTDEQAIAITLWVAHVFAFAAASTTPYLHVSSATPRAGKSRLLEVLEALLGEDRCMFTMNVSPAALYRVIDANPGTAVLVDESDRLLAGNRERAEELAGLINSGFRRRGGHAVRMVGQGAKLTPQRFRTFAPKAIAGIGTLPDTVADRAIPIRMRRRLPSEPIERFREADAESAASVREVLETWAIETTIAALSSARPGLPRELDDRAQDAWEPLLAIADGAGERWAMRARAAAITLHGAAAEYVEEALELLALRHVREALEGDRMFSTAIVEALVRREDGPWAEWWGADVSVGRSVAAARRLARLLKPFGIQPRQLRIGDRTAKGYDAIDLQDAAARYLAQGTETAVTTGTPLASTVSDVPGVSVVTGAEPRLALGDPETNGAGGCRECGGLRGHRTACSYWSRRT